MQGRARGNVIERDAAFYEDVVRGLSASPKRLSSKYFYDARGSVLFDGITRLNEYYLTRIETELLERHIGEIAESICAEPVVFEFGSGSSAKTRILLDRLGPIRAYVPMDISGAYLEHTVAALREAYPDTDIYPLAADYARTFRLPEQVREHQCVLAFFPGSTIGNFNPVDAVDFLRRIYATLPSQGFLLIGVDLIKERGILERAYNDSQGLTAEFNKNLLRRINDELGGNFPIDVFAHRATFNADESRMEMHLVATAPCSVRVDGNHRFHFTCGESIHTENSYKYTIEKFAGIAHEVGFNVRRVWTDPAQLFSVQLLTKSKHPDK